MAILLRGRAAVVLDNLTGKVDSSVLAGVLTSTWWGGRLLGGNLHVDLPNRTTWVATANNANLSTEIARRSVLIRIDAQTDRPFERHIKYRHPALLDYERTNRGLIVAAVLTIFAGMGRRREAACAPGPWKLRGVVACHRRCARLRRRRRVP